MKSKMTAFALGSMVIALAGCTAGVNLARRRGNYDAYLDMPVRAEGAYQEKLGYYNQILGITSSPQASPYPALGADLKVMKRHIDDMKSRRQGILDFEKKYDRFADGRTAITEKQEAEWQQFKALDAEFKPLGQSMQVTMQGFNEASTDFDRTLQSYHVGKVRITDLEKEINDFREELKASMENMGQRLHEEHRLLKEAQADHWDQELIRRKSELLENMEKSFESARATRQNAQQAADVQFGNLPEGDFMWTGPGMEDDGTDLGNLRQAEAGFRARVREFSDLGNRFEAVQRPAVTGK